METKKIIANLKKASDKEIEQLEKDILTLKRQRQLKIIDNKDLELLYKEVEKLCNMRGVSTEKQFSISAPVIFKLSFGLKKKQFCLDQETVDEWYNEAFYLSYKDQPNPKIEYIKKAYPEIDEQVKEVNKQFFNVKEFFKKLARKYKTTMKTLNEKMIELFNGSPEEWDTISWKITRYE